MIEGKCFTNLDEYRHEIWPDIFVDLPRNGDGVRAESGKILYVVSVNHDIKIDDNGKKQPYVEVELHSYAKR